MEIITEGFMKNKWEESHRKFKCKNLNCKSNKKTYNQYVYQELKGICIACGGELKECH